MTHWPKMQIITISPSRQSNQVWIKFDNHSYLPLKIDDIVHLKIKKFVDISPEFYTQIQERSVYYLILEYSLRQIAISPKVEVLLRQKIKIFSQKIIHKYYYPVPLVAAQTNDVIHKVVSLGYLDEQHYVDYLTKKFSKKSITELNYRLSTLGIRQTVSPNSEDEHQKILILIRKKYNNADLSDYNTKNKIIASLYRKGFAIGHIKNAIDECLKVR